ncbi:MAG: acetate--CoA ligase family protein [Candidatus Micrarchaeia archaeon]
MLLEYMQAKSLLEKYGIRSIESTYVGSEKELIDFIEKVGSNVVIKAISEKALHKSKAGLVMLNISEENAASSFNSLVKKAKPYAPFKVLAQKMAEPGVEMVIGGREDDQFGKLILLGLGGIFVEAFKDFSLRVCPIERYDAEKMISELRSRDVITYNGKAEKMVVELLMKVSKMLQENEIKELDLNPIIIRQNSYDAVDLRVIE